MYEYIEFARESIGRMGKATRRTKPSILVCGHSLKCKSPLKHKRPLNHSNDTSERRELDFENDAYQEVQQEERALERKTNAQNYKVTLNPVDPSGEESRDAPPALCSRYTKGDIKPPSPSDDIFQSAKEITPSRHTLGLGCIDHIQPGKHAFVATFAAIIMASVVPGGASKIASLVFNSANTWIVPSTETEQEVASLMAECDDADLPDLVNELTKNMYRIVRFLKPGASIHSVLSAFERNSCRQEDVVDDGCFGMPWRSDIDGEAAEAEPVVCTNYHYNVRTQWKEEWHKNHPSPIKLACASMVVDTAQYSVSPKTTL